MAWQYALFAIPGSYICISIILLRFPTLLHRKKNVKVHAKHISHRGGAGEKLENTMEAFKRACDCGTEMLEIDIQCTSDKKIVVAHDNNLKRMCGQNVNISDLNYEDLPPILGSLPLQFDSKAICHDESNCKKFVLLRDLFKEFPTMPINIDIKTYSDFVVEEVRDMIHEFDRVEISPWGNFSYKTTQALYKMDPNIPLIFSMRRYVSTIVSFYIGLLPFLPIKESFLEVLMPSPLLRENLGFKFNFLLRIIDCLTMSPILIKHLQRRGIKVYLWVLNSEEDFQRAFIKLGVDGVMTDYPTKLKLYLEQNKI